MIASVQKMNKIVHRSKYEQVLNKIKHGKGDSWAKK